MLYDSSDGVYSADSSVNMIVNEKKKLNKFKQVRIPRNKDLFARIGGRDLPMHSDGHTADFNTRQIDKLQAQIDDYETQMLRENQMPADTDTAPKESEQTPDA